MGGDEVDPLKMAEDIMRLNSSVMAPQQRSNIALQGPYMAQGGTGLGFLGASMGQGWTEADQMALDQLQGQSGRWDKMIANNARDPFTGAKSQARLANALSQQQQMYSLMNKKAMGQQDFGSLLEGSPLFQAMQNQSQTPAMRALAARGLSLTDGMNSEMLGRLNSGNLLNTFNVLNSNALAQAGMGQTGATNVGQLNSNLASGITGGMQAAYSQGNTMNNNQSMMNQGNMMQGMQGIGQGLGSYYDPNNQLNREVSTQILNNPNLGNYITSILGGSGGGGSGQLSYGSTSGMNWGGR